MNRKFILVFFIGFSCFVCAQESTLPVNCEDKQIFSLYLEKNKNVANSSLDSLLVKTALSFLNTPYEASTLEVTDNEQLVVNLRAFDCMTFVESCFALSMTIHLENPDFDAFKKFLQTIRYRDGVISGYTSRLHYTSDWITNNQKKGILEDITSVSGGIPLPLYVDFMSTHPQSYPYLSKHPEDIANMRLIEDSINNHTYYYIPKEKIKDYEKYIKPGDIICFVTSIKGLDISHLGIAYRKNRMLTFIHASTIAQKVIINPVSIADYCKNIRSNKGIIIVRCEW